jgi:hypothetical protein
MKKTRSTRDTVPLSLQIQIHTGSRKTGGGGGGSHFAQERGWGGGPKSLDSTETLVFYIYKTHFSGCIHEVCMYKLVHIHNAHLENLTAIIYKTARPSS